MKLSDFSVKVPDELKPQIDTSTPHGQRFADEGVVILENFMPHDLIDIYADVFRDAHRSDAEMARGFGIGTPYMMVEEIKMLCLYKPFMDILNILIPASGPMGMHLNLTGWKSTERNWHQDDYLNPPYINAHYAGVWFALDDIHEDAGPFEYVPGSHRHLDVCRGDRIRAALPAEKAMTPDWPKYSEEILNDLYDEEIKRNGWQPVSWAGKKGDVLIWHGWLLHRGSRPKNPALYRPTIITHYSSLNNRVDMQEREIYTNNDTNSHGYIFRF